jgi:hypothetical protein
MEKTITAILIGAGNRGMDTYGNFALKYPGKLNFVAVAEPIRYRREKFAQLHEIPSNRSYNSWEDILGENKIADVAFICTQDQMHVEPTLEALDKGYNVLLEKPMAHTLEGCIKIFNKVEETSRILGVCHVLRYTNFFSTIKDTIQKGLLGDIVNISHRENVSWYHMAHSFVRGNWRNVKSSSPMILAKCCHDLDLLYWMVGVKTKKISSFGGLKHFASINAPKNSPDYCVEGCPIESSCLYYAPRIYIDIVPIIQVLEKSNQIGFKILANLRKKHIKLLTMLSKPIKLIHRLRYWREWLMHGFSEREGRTLRIDGTKATLIGQFSDAGQEILLFDHFSGTEKVIFTQKLSIDSSGHGGGDFVLVDAFLETLLNKSKSQPLTNAYETLESHLMAFAANESRLQAKVIDMQNFRIMRKI